MRRAHRGDVAAIARLMQRARAQDGMPRPGEPEIDELMNHGEIVVLAVAQEVLAAACLTVRHAHAHLAFLVCDPDVPGAEARLHAAMPSVFGEEPQVRLAS